MGDVSRILQTPRDSPVELWRSRVQKIAEQFKGRQESYAPVPLLKADVLLILKNDITYGKA